MQACLSPTVLAAPSAPDYHVSTAEQSERFVDTHNKRGTPLSSGKDSAIPAALFDSVRLADAVGGPDQAMIGTGANEHQIEGKTSL
jgi:hypothetical protein